MTSNGSLAYYLAAWVCGCSFAAVALWFELAFTARTSLQGTFQGTSFLGLCFFGLILGAVPSLLFGWILRRCRAIFSRGKGELWLWIIAGAVLALALIWSLGQLGQLARDPRYLPYSALPIWPFLLTGPLAILEGSIWITLPVGGATGAVLFAVNRAFQPQPNP